MRVTERVCATTVMLCTGLVMITGIGSSAAHASTGQRHARVITDGRLRPGHLETIWLVGFPGKGVVAASFFPTAICEDGCGSRGFRVAEPEPIIVRTNGSHNG